MELTTFRLRDGVDEQTFRAADAEAQAFFHLQPGLLRRTTMRDAAGSGEWLVACLWSTWAQADAAAAAARTSEVMQAFDALVDPASVAVRRFESLD